MFGLSFWEIAVILGIALLVFGPSKLPDLARNLGKGIREFRKAASDFKTTMDDEVHRPEHPPAQLGATDRARIAPSHVQPVEIVKNTHVDDASEEKAVAAAPKPPESTHAKDEGRGGSSTS